MDDRLHREKDFHNKAFSQGTRACVDKYYELCRNSRDFYMNTLAELCRGREPVALEYGCGPGSYAFFLRNQGATVHGIDISDVAVQQATQEAAREDLDRTTFHVMDAEALTFPDDSFDLICGTGILHHLDLDRAFSELARTLKPEGTAVFVEPLGHNPLINHFRARTPQLRTVDEHPLLMSDLEKARRFFGELQCRYFHLSTLGAVPLRRMPGFPKLLKALDGFDRTLFTVLPPVRRLAWQVVIMLSQPLKQTAGAPNRANDRFQSV